MFYQSPKISRLYKKGHLSFEGIEGNTNANLKGEGQMNKSKNVNVQRKGKGHRLFIKDHYTLLLKKMSTFI